MTSHPAQRIEQSSSEAATRQLAGRLALAARGGLIIYLCGQLGAGKTTFVRGFLRALGYEGKVKSPTYTIVEPYELPSLTIHHFDLYRLRHPDELLQLGMEEYFTPQSICLVEWPDKGKPHLPEPDLICYFDIIKQTRQIRFEARTTSGQEILARL